MNTAISITAMCISFMLLIVHYQNQLERRHGEIVNVRADILKRLAIIQQRLTSNLLHAESARFELRLVHDCDVKFEMIEEMPSLIHEMKDSDALLKELTSKLKELDTKTINRTDALLTLQSLAHSVTDLEGHIAKFEAHLVSFRQKIQAA